MILTVSGVPGSGKTTAGKLVADKLGYAFYSIGGLRAKMAEEHGMTIDELNALGETDPSTDTAVDEEQRKLGETQDDFVVEGRLSWHFIPRSFKVFLTCDPDEAARRIYLAKREGDREDEPSYETIASARKQLDERMASDERRYQAIYGVNYRDEAHYDLVIDTTNLKGPEETAKRILHALKERALA